MNRSFRNLCALTLVFAMVTLLSAMCTPAQTFRGTILGTVTDSSGAAVPGATVTIKNLGTGLFAPSPHRMTAAIQSPSSRLAAIA